MCFFSLKDYQSTAHTTASACKEKELLLEQLREHKGTQGEWQTGAQETARKRPGRKRGLWCLGVWATLLNSCGLLNLVVAPREWVASGE